VSAPPAVTTSHLEAAVEHLVAGLGTAGRSGTVSVWCGTPQGRTLWSREPAAVHYAASTMKLPVVLAAHRRADRGELDLDRPVPVHPDFASALAGETFVMSQDDDQDDETWEAVGTDVPLRELARRAIVRSGNLAANLVLEHAGTDEVAAVLAAAGCSPATVLPRGIEDAPARGAGLDNLVTAEDLGRVVAGLATRRLADESSCQEVEAVLAAQEHNEQIPAGLPAGTYVAHKTGWVDGVAHDVGLVRPTGEPFVLSVCTSVDAPEDVLYALNAGITAAVWEWLVGTGGTA
jgi:beta-lactamase class A